MDSFQNKIEQELERIITSFVTMEVRVQRMFSNTPDIYAAQKKGFRTYLKIHVDFQTEYFTAKITAYDPNGTPQKPIEVHMINYTEERKIKEFLDKIENSLKETK